ncbi:hypothetical protein ACFQ0G_53720 [Streptomyces chiangmaiensis]|uniref:hypothetical protein n=1 Tax=Streptomyces chiangmaiensis TaxID=766497 RepID=UPI0031EDD6FE
MSDRQRDYNNSAKGQARKAAYRQRNRDRIAAADRARTVRERAERRRWLDDCKMQRGCADCGYKQHPKALDFDHVRGEKLGDIGRLSHTSIAWSRLMAEIAKREVVCANCHRIRTHNRDQHRASPKKQQSDLAKDRFAQGVLDFGGAA